MRLCNEREPFLCTVEAVSLGWISESVTCTAKVGKKRGELKVLPGQDQKRIGSVEALDVDLRGELEVLFEFHMK